MTDSNPATHPVTEAASVGRYAAVWRLPGAPTLVVAGFLGRLPVGMTALILVLLIGGETGSYASAGGGITCYAVANAAVGPVLGRLADRFHPMPVLLATAAGYPVAAAAMLAAVLLGAPTGLIWASAALLGACLPPLTATLRSTWSTLTESPRQVLRGPALALETTAFQLLFVLGPLVVGGLAAVASPSAALVLAAVCVAGGTTTVALGRAMRTWKPHPSRPRVQGWNPAAAPGMPRLLLVAAAVASALGMITLSVAAFAEQHAASNADSVASLLLGLWGAGGVTGGIWFGTRRFRAPLPTQWAVALATLAAGMAVLAVVPSTAAMAIALFVGGLSLTPALTMENALVARTAQVGMVNEAYTWVSTVTYTAYAGGASLAGMTVETLGVSFAFGLAATSTAAGAALAVLHPPLRRGGRPRAFRTAL